MREDGRAGTGGGMPGPGRGRRPRPRRGRLGLPRRGSPGEEPPGRSPSQADPGVASAPSAPEGGSRPDPVSTTGSSGVGSGAASGPVPPGSPGGRGEPGSASDEDPRDRLDGNHATEAGPGGEDGDEGEAGQRRVREAATATARGAARAGAATGHLASYTVRQARRATHAEGAGASGLSRIIELHAFNAAGDAAVAISLAGTLFFQVPTGEARGQVALFLALTMMPFAIVAPLIGPFLDKFSHGRRWAIGTTMATRAFLCWGLASAVATDSVLLYPAALGVLVASKAYGVTRAAAVPRVTPPTLGLVKANSRISLAGLTGAAVSAPLAVMASIAGPQWSLRYAFLIFVVATVLAILLPDRVDQSIGEERADLTGHARAVVPSAVVRGLRCNAGVRLLSGFLTLFMAFLLRDQPFAGWESRPELLIILVIGSAGLGSTIGVALGSTLKTVRPGVAVVATLLADTVVTLTVAVFYALPMAMLLGLTAGLAQSFGKLSLDALIQGQVPERTRASAFARSETLLQLSWVAGGFLGILLPLIPQVGLGVAGGVLLAVTAWVVTSSRAGLR